MYVFQIFIHIFASLLDIYSFMREFSDLKTVNGDKVYSLEYIQHLRDLDRKKNNPLKIIAQRGAQERMLWQDVDIMICGGNRGGSKPLIKSTKVVTPFGYRELGRLKAGDIITGVDGCMQKVIYNIDKGKLPCYKLTFIDGSSCISSYDHAWNIRKTCYNRKKRNLNNGSLSDNWTIWTTEMIVDFLKKKENGKVKNGHIVIPITKPVKFTIPTDRKGIDPYVLGLLLGDGCLHDSVMKNNGVLISTADEEIVNSIANAGYFIKKRSKTPNYDYLIKSKELVSGLIGFGLKGCDSLNKFIPRPFKYGTIEERFAVLQGLMDTDGTIDDRGHCSFTSISKQLAEDVKFLVGSLGGIATITKGKAGYKKDGLYIPCNDAYTVYIKIEDSNRIFRLSRKKEKSKPFNGGVGEYTRRIVGYEYVGEMDCCCIRVSNPDSLFLVEDFIVTHNTYSLLLEALPDVNNKHFNAILLRNEKEDLADVVKTAYNIYSQYGTYNKSINDMTWNFNSGGTLKFSYYADSFEDFKTRFRGKQYSYIGIDEVTQISYEKFKFLLTDNRNAYGIRNRFWGTCNPDPDSWVRFFIDWWIGEDGLPIEERDGKIRYCFMEGDTPNSIYWGDTPEEVYEQCKDIIDPLWRPEYESLGFDKVRMFVKSVVFVRAKLEDNVKLIASDPNYVANLANQDEEQRTRDLEGNWNFKSSGDDMLKMEDMEKFYANSIQTGDNPKLYATCDIAFTGGDSLVMWLWEGWHIKDLFVCRNDARMALSMVKEKLTEWGVQEKNFVFDLNGIGQSFKGFFPDAMGFNNMESPIATSSNEKNSIKFMYGNLKSQCAYLFVKKIKNLEVSINNSLLDLKFSGDGFEKVPLRNILQKERKAIRANEDASDKGFTIINKKTMKKYVGHSPDYFESLIFRMAFELKHRHNKPKNIWMVT